MNLIVRWKGDEYEVAVEVDDGRVPIADLADTLVGEAAASIAVDGRMIDSETPIDEVALADGVTVELGNVPDPRVIGYLIDAADPNHPITLVPGTVTVGARPADLPADGVAGRVVVVTSSSGRISVRNHGCGRAAIDGHPFDAADLSVGEVLTVGSRRLSIAATAPRRSRHGLFNRPPRLLPAALAPEIGAPPPAIAPSAPMRFAWGALVVPLVLGLVMAVLVHPRMALFAVFSPVMLLANWFEDRRRIRRDRRENTTARAEALTDFVRALDRLYAEERHRLLASAPPIAELVDRAVSARPQLWERRPAHPDFMEVAVGAGCLPWTVAVDGALDIDSQRALGDRSELHNVPVTLAFDAGVIAGAAGHRSAVLGLVRQVVIRAAIDHGPADLALSVFTEDPVAWDWVKWLPHSVADASGRRRIAIGRSEVDSVLTEVDRCSHRRHLVVVDVGDLSARPHASLRGLLEHAEELGVAALVMAQRPIDLPSLSVGVISLAASQSQLRKPDGSVVGITPWLLSTGMARRTARALARVDDPELVLPGEGLPEVVYLPALLSMSDGVTQRIRENWAQDSPRFDSPFGSTADGPLLIDLIADGPHGLIAGTTGAGKSELLRSIVAGLASRVHPRFLNLLLIDYKGGSAFDACSVLPHVAGVVTDLDEHLAARALTCLNAELQYREKLLRGAGASDIAELHAAGGDLPRLVILVDEFAALAAELPEFMDSLVGVAQRGRSLGVHLLLATQRPSGVVSESIKANTNLRIALRVQDHAESMDVIGSGDAATVNRRSPGRGFARLGPGDIVSFQTALSTATSLRQTRSGLSIRPFVIGTGSDADSPGSAGGNQVEPSSDLELIVAACRKVATELGLAAPRSPWPPPLPHMVVRSECSEVADGVVFGIADDPGRQRRESATWNQASGSLLIYGVPGSGSTTFLATLVLGLAEADRATHIYVVDCDDQALAPLQQLPSVGAVVGAGERQRQQRLFRLLAGELEQRRRTLASSPRAADRFVSIVLLIDNYRALVDEYAGPGDDDISNVVGRLVADGPGVGIYAVITAKQPSDVPSRIAAAVTNRIALRLADRYEYGAIGIPAVEPPAVKGRGYEAGTGREIQVAVPHNDGIAAAVAAANPSPPTSEPWTIRTLPSQVAVAEFAAAGRIDADEWFIPLGIGDTSLCPVGWQLGEGEHALISGPPRSGKSTALATVAAVAREADHALSIVAILPRRSALREAAAVDRVVGIDELEDAANGSGLLLLIDDAELVDDDGYLARLLRKRQPGVKVVAAAGADSVRSMYGHWSQDLRRSRMGCALRPSSPSDGDLWQTPLPRVGDQHFPAGRGFLLADGRAELIQLGRD